MSTGTITYFAFICSINLFLAALVFSRNPRRLTNQLFSLSVLSIVLWTFFVFLGTGRGIAWKQGSFVVASVIPVTFLAFCRSFPSGRRLQVDASFALFICLGLFFAGASLSNLIVTSVHYSGSHVALVYGPLYPYFAAYLLTCFLAGFRALWHTYKASTGIDRLRSLYLLVGILLTFLGATTTNLLIPLFSGSNVLRLVGPGFTVFVFAFVAHAILRYRLMDITWALQRSATYAIALALSLLLLLGASLLLLAAFGHSVSSDTFLATVLAGTVIALAFPRILAAVHRLLNLYFRRPTSTHSQTLTAATKTLFTFLEHQTLFEHLWQLLIPSIGAGSLAVYLYDGTTLRLLFSCSAHPRSTSPAPPEQLSATSLILRSFTESVATKSLTPLLREELSNSPLAADLAYQDWDLVLPLASHRGFRGILALGPKISGDPFFSGDLDLLQTLVNQVSLVLTNVDLYEQVKNVRDRLEAILNRMESGVIVTDAVGRIDTVNPAAEAMLARAVATLLGAPLDSLPAPLAQAVHRAAHYREAVFQQEVEFLNANQDVVCCLLSTSLLTHPSDTMAGVILVFHDHSRLRELEKQKQRAERLSAFQTMASTIAHEIKNPLVAIRTFAELLPERYTDVDFRVDFSRVVVREISRITGLIDGLRGLTATPTAELPLVDIRIPLHDTLALLRGKLERHDITLLYNDRALTHLVRGNAAQLAQLFLNLCLNAIDAVGGSGSISITLSNDDTSPRTLTIEIADSGGGIPAELLPNVFDPFITTKSQGSGLGLAICKSIANFHQAKIRASHSTELGGAVIAIEFPAATIAPSASLAQKSW